MLARTLPAEKFAELQASSGKREADQIKAVKEYLKDSRIKLVFLPPGFTNNG